MKGPEIQLKPRGEDRGLADLLGKRKATPHAVPDDLLLYRTLLQLVEQDRYQFPASASWAAVRNRAIFPACSRISANSSGSALKVATTFSVL